VLIYEKKETASKTIGILKDPDGNVKFLKIGIGPWEKVEVEDRAKMENKEC